MIKQAIRTLAANDDEVYSVVGKVTAVDASARTCDVEPLNGDALLFDIRLQSEQSIAEGVVLIPAVGSWVIVTFTSKADGYVAERSRVDKILWGVNEQKLEYTKDGLVLENGVNGTMKYTNDGLTLKSATANFADEFGNVIDILDKLLTTLTTFTVGTNVGPSIGVLPPSITDLVQHKINLALAKTKLQTMLK